MRFTVDKTEFLKALNQALKAIPQRSATPILTNAKLELTDRGLEVTGSNGDIVIRSIVPYMVNGIDTITNVSQGGTLVNGKYLNDVVRKAQGQTITAEVIDDAIFKIDDLQSNFKLRCISADEYPDTPLEPQEASLDIRCSDFVDLIEQSAFSAATREQRKILTAVHLSTENGKLIASATDSARLARKEIAIEGDVHISCNIAAKTALSVAHSFENAKEVQFSVSSNSALFVFGNTTISSRLIDGEFPLTRYVFPTTFNDRLIVNANEFLDALDRAKDLSSDSEPVVTLNAGEDEVTVSSKSDAAGSALIHLNTFQYAGARISVNFNSNLVMEGIKAMKADEVCLCFQSEARPFVVKKVKDESVVEVVTPMRVY